MIEIRENDLQLLCITRFESTLLKLSQTDKDMLAEFMRVLMQLAEMNTRHIIYTTKSTKKEVINLLKECAPRKNFISKDDIFCLSEMTDFPQADQKSCFIFWAINEHNRTQPNKFVDTKKVKECVLVLDDDIKLMNRMSSYTAPIHVEGNLTYIQFLDNIYKTLHLDKKNTKLQQANELRRLSKMADNFLVEDQELMSINYQVRNANISSNIAEGMLNLIVKIKRYLSIVKVFTSLGTQLQKGILSNFKEEVAKIIRESRLASDEYIEAMLLELQAMQLFSWEYANLKFWLKLSFDFCLFIWKFFEGKISLKTDFSFDEKILSNRDLLTICLQELNDLVIKCLGGYHENILQQTHIAQKTDNGKFKWLLIEGDKNKKDIAIKMALELCKPLVEQQINAEKACLVKNQFNVEKLHAYYEKKCKDSEENKQELYTRMGNRDAELREQRDQHYAVSQKLTRQALFESTVGITRGLPSQPGAYFGTNLRYSVMHSAPATERNLATIEKKADLFELCRSNDVSGFIQEVYTQLSTAYDSEDIMSLLKLYFNYSPECVYLLNGLSAGTYLDLDGNGYSVCLVPPIPLVVNVKQNLGIYLDKSFEKGIKKDVFDEIKPLLIKPNSFIKIIFPYQTKHQDKIVWVVGEIKINIGQGFYNISLSTINPYGSGKFDSEILTSLCNTLRTCIEKINPSAKINFKHNENHFSPCLDKEDKVSSGVVAVEIILNSILLNNKIPSDYAKSLNIKNFRRKHVIALKTLNENNPGLRRFLSRHLDIDQVTLAKKSLLETALQYGCVGIVGFLIDDMLVSVDDSLSGYPPIFSALKGMQRYPDRVNLVRYILQGTTDLSRGDSKKAVLRKLVDSEGNPLLHVAISHAVDRSVETLVKWGTERPGTLELFAKSKENRSALHEAICTSKYGRLHGTIKILLKYGLGQSKASLEGLHQDNIEEDTLRYIIRYIDKQLKLVEEFLPKQTLQRTRSNSLINLPIFQRSRSGSIIGGMMTIFSPRVSYEWKTLVANNCAENKIASLPTNVEELNSIQEGFAAIHVACTCGTVQLLDHLIKQKVNLNLATKAEINRKLGDGKDETPELVKTTQLTPLHLAVLCQRKSPDFFYKLLAQNVQFTQDSNGCTALHYAASRDSKSVEAILTHLEKTNSLELAYLRDTNGHTALTKAILAGDKTLILPFVHLGIWPSETDLLIIKTEITSRENKVEIKQALIDVFGILKSRYETRLNLKQQTLPAVPTPK